MGFYWPQESRFRLATMWSLKQKSTVANLIVRNDPVPIKLYAQWPKSGVLCQTT